MTKRSKQGASPAAQFRELARLHVRAQRAEIGCRGWSVTRCSIVTELGRGEGISLGELAQRLRLDKGWVSRAVEQLVRDGTILRSTDPGDRRSVVLSLTAAGKKQFEELEATLNGQLDRVMARVPAAEQGRVADALALLLEAYESEIAAECGSAVA